jgi:endonuclease YncB( thermonuclease family)
MVVAARRPAKRVRPCGVPLERYLRWRTPVRWGIALLVVFLVLALAWLDQRGVFVYRGGDLQRYDGHTFTVSRVIDGDTLELAAPDGHRPATRVRFWGVDAPEVDHDGPPIEHEPWGDEARRFTRAAVEGKRVRLTLEPSRMRDRYDRVLVFVALPDGQVLNEALIARGLARVDQRWTHRFSQRYELLEQQAKHDRVGIWSGK